MTAAQVDAMFAMIARFEMLADLDREADASPTTP